MGRYLQVSGEIASNIESGLLGPGAELPSIRDAADRYKTTGSTIDPDDTARLITATLLAAFTPQTGE
jgi:DNA-binding transcriptional MocR family regulator